MRGHFGRLALVALAILCAGSGCVVPSYHLPAGFSSSYQRQLYGMEPGPTPQESGLAVIGSRPGIFYPMTAFGDQPVAVERTSYCAPPTPLILGSDPISPPKPVKKPPPDDF